MDEFTPEERAQRLAEIRQERIERDDRALAFAKRKDVSDVDALARLLHAREFWHTDGETLDEDGRPYWERMRAQALPFIHAGFRRNGSRMFWGGAVVGLLVSTFVDFLQRWVGTW